MVRQNTQICVWSFTKKKVNINKEEVTVNRKSINPSLNTNNEMDSQLPGGNTNEIMYEYFPKKFERRLIDSIDMRFAIIWLVTFLIHFSTVLYFSIHPINTQINKSEIKKIQAQYANLILKKEIVEERRDVKSAALKENELDKNADQDSEEKDAAGENENKSSEAKVTLDKSSHKSRNNKYGSNQKTGQPSQTRNSGEVSSIGLLGLLTGSPKNSQGEGVADILGDAADMQGNLKEALSNINGIKKPGDADRAGDSGNRSRAMKGTRTGSEGGIDHLIADRDRANSKNIKRQGTLIEADFSAVNKEKGGSTGGRDPDEISEVVNRHSAAVQSCYQREVKRNPDLKGKIVVRFTITPEGKVNKVELISSTLNNSRVERCVISRIRRWDDFGQIDQSIGNATFRQVYTFGY